MANRLLDVFAKRSLSLVELMIVSVIVAIFIAIIGQEFLGFDDDSKNITVQQNVRSIKGALSLYRKDIGHYPKTSEGLNALIVNDKYPKWNGPYLKEEILTDPWGDKYQYILLSADKYRLFSKRIQGTKK